ncbi:YceI family protein [Paenibacillus sambharensis]|uniref:YceI family protein n=1 Tax=Paenibacillus sambharensis TaxID=1803190 RepID=A0A2W1LJR3_9BACL|nr:YceI family protein [Paenibacillus sambharensis]PZD94784.1 YceI family protein [Paenibacillus sambharensis]
MKKTAWIALGAAVVLAGGAYMTFDYFTGNHVEVREVIGKADSAAAASGEAVEAEQLNGVWQLAEESEVYLSLKTSKEPVNMTLGNVEGSWTIDMGDASQMKGEGKIDLSGVDSGNPTRDDHIKGDRFLDTGKYPEAAFEAAAFEGLPEQWQEGVPVPFQMKGTMTVRGITKDVVFDSKAVYEQGQVKMEGSTVVTFADFGMENPHQVLVETENDVKVQLQLILNKAQA